MSEPHRGVIGDDYPDYDAEIESREDTPPADVMEMSGVQFEMGKDTMLGYPTLSVSCAGYTHGPYVFHRTELGALAAWLNDHAEAGDR